MAPQLLLRSRSGLQPAWLGMISLLQAALPPPSRWQGSALETARVCAAGAASAVVIDVWGAWRAPSSGASGWSGGFVGVGGIGWGGSVYPECNSMQGWAKKDEVKKLVGELETKSQPHKDPGLPRVGFLWSWTSTSYRGPVGGLRVSCKANLTSKDLCGGEQVIHKVQNPRGVAFLGIGSPTFYWHR